MVVVVVMLLLPPHSGDLLKSCTRHTEADNTTLILYIFQHCDYHTAAEGLGAKGLLLGRNDSISGKLKEAQKLHAEGHSVVINALIGSTKFREGSISV